MLVFCTAGEFLRDESSSGASSYENAGPKDKTK